MTLGDREIDFSPSFSIFLSTRDNVVQFAPDLCSRVTFVNFTVTPSSLQSQCLSQILKAERPEVQQKRSDLLKLQGQFKVELRKLENQLLTELNKATGAILDDDSLIATLEKLKTEAKEVEEKVSQTEVVMAEVINTSAMYNPLSQACSRIYFTTEQACSII